MATHTTFKAKGTEQKQLFAAMDTCSLGQEIMQKWERSLPKYLQAPLNLATIVETYANLS